MIRRKPEIETLSEARWAQVEAALFERPRPRNQSGIEAPRRASHFRAVAIAVSVTAACAAAGFVAWRMSSERAPSIVASRVETRDSASHVDVDDSSLDVAPYSAVRFSGDDRAGHLVVLEHGSVDCEVTPRHGRPPFVVRSGDVTVSVVGTHFRVTHENGSTSVRVDRGAVEVDDGAHHVVLHDGEVWPSSAPMPSFTLPDPTLPATGSTPAPSFSTPEPRRITPAPTVSATVVRASPGERYRDAQRLEATRPDEAVGIYRELASGTGAWAMNALFAAGRLEAERGHRESARRLLQEYGARFPTGPNVEDAQRLIAGMR